MKREWGDEQEQAFLQIKASLAQYPTLRIPRYGPNETFVVQTDASTVGIGAVLLQKDRNDGRMHPIVYLSRGLQPNEKNYDPQKLEGLAVVWAIDRLRHHLRGHRFEVHTDHANLEWILTANHIKRPQMARWKQVLAEFNFKLRYEQDVQIADALSRDPRFEHVIHRTDPADMIATTVPPSAAAKRAVELACGGGGTGIGLNQAGYQVVAGMDLSATALLTYSRVHPHAEPIRQDLADVESTVNHLRRLMPLDLITITTPCAPWSAANPKPDPHDPRADLVVSATAAAVRVRPTAIIYESTPRYKNSAHWKAATKILIDAEYAVEHTTISAKHLGVP